MVIFTTKFSGLHYENLFFKWFHLPIWPPKLAGTATFATFGAGAAMQDAISPMGTEPEASGDFGVKILDKLKWSNYLQDGAPQICLLAYKTI